MEVSAIRPNVPRTAPLAPAVPAAALLPQKAAEKTDRFELSQEIKEKMREQQKAHLEELARVEKDAKAAQEQAEAQAEAFKVLMRCIKIAGRIINGDIVPGKDEQYLLENEPKLYQMAVAARIPKEDPEEFDSVLEDEEERADSEAPEASGEAPGPPALSGGESAPAPEVPVEG